MKAIGCFLLAAFGAAVPAGARAADRPPAMPSRDASVVYRVEPAGGPAQSVHVAFGRGGEMLRVDGPGGQGDTVLDRRTGELTVVMNAQRAFMVVPSRGPVHDPFLLGDDMTYARTGTHQTIAGETCDDWRVGTPKGPGTACVTPDGLLLAASGPDSAGVSGRITAESVSRAPVPPSAFQPPAGFTRVAHPASQP